MNKPSWNALGSLARQVRATHFRAVCHLDMSQEEQGHEAVAGQHWLSLRLERPPVSPRSRKLSQ